MSISHRLAPVLFALLLGCAGDSKSPDTGTADSAAGESPAEDEDFHWPSPDGYDDPGIPGWLGRTRISTTPGCWLDTDGVDPAVAGCHTLQAGTDACATCEDVVTERIGEACYTFSRVTADGSTEEGTFLVETNPAAGVCHEHVDGVGHPDVFDCDAYCKGSTDPESGAAYSGGACAAIDDETCPGGVQASAHCACTL